MPRIKEGLRCVTIWLSDEDYAAVSTIAQLREATPTGIVRAIVEQFLAQPFDAGEALTVDVTPRGRPRHAREDRTT